MSDTSSAPQSSKKTVMISCEGDRDFADAFAFFARKKGKMVAELVRAALNEKYGEEFEIWEAFYKDPYATPLTPPKADAEGELLGSK